MKYPDIIKVNYGQLVELCEKHRVSQLYLFGSAVTDKFDDYASDFDFLVALEPMLPLERGETLLQLWTDLEVLLNRKVDLLTDQPIKNTFLQKSIDLTKQLIYDRAGQKVSV